MMNPKRPVVASKATAERQFVVGKGHPDKDTNIISEADFERLLKLDTTPTKKYIHAICRWLVMPEIGFITGKDRRLATHNYWSLPQDGELQYEVSFGPTISLSVQLHHLVTNRGVLVSLDRDDMEWAFADYEMAQDRKLPVRDPNSFSSIEDFFRYLDALNDKYHYRDSAKLKEGLKGLYKDYHSNRSDFVLFKDNSDFLVLGLLDYESSKYIISDYMGEVSHWCVTRQLSYWEEYRDDRDCCFYWVVSKKEYRQCWMVQVPGDKSRETFTVWDWDDNPISGVETKKLLSRLGVDNWYEFDILEVPGKRKIRNVGVIYIRDKNLNFKFDGGFELEFSDLESDPYSEFMEKAKIFVESSEDIDYSDMENLLIGTEGEYGSYGKFISEMGLNEDYDTVDELNPWDSVPGFDNFVSDLWTDVIKSRLFSGGNIFLEVSPAWLSARGVSWPTNFSDDNYKDYERALEGWFQKYSIPVDVKIHSVYGQVYVDWSFDSVDLPFEKYAKEQMQNSYLLSLLYLKMLLYMHQEFSIDGVQKLMTRKGSSRGLSQDPGTNLSLETAMVSFTNTWLDRYYR